MSMRNTSRENVNKDDSCCGRLLHCLCCRCCLSTGHSSHPDVTKKFPDPPPVHITQPRKSLLEEFISANRRVDNNGEPNLPVPYLDDIEESDGNGTDVVTEDTDEIKVNNFTVFGWGNNFNGELGFGIGHPEESSPTAIHFPSKIKSVACGDSHTLFVLNDGTLWSCGSNDDGQLGHEMNNSPQKVEGLDRNKIVAASAGFAHNLVLCSKGQLFSWGSNSHGQLGCAGEARQINRPTFIPFERLPSKRIVQVAAGDFHSLVMTMDGEIYSCGSNSHGQLGLGPHIGTKQKEFRLVITLLGFPAAQIQAGGMHSFALSVHGAVFGWGRNNCGQLGVGSLDDKCIPTSLEMFNSIVVRYISAGSDHTAFLTQDGGVFTFGSNKCGQLGHGSFINEVYPRKILEFGSIIVQIACGRAHTLCVTEGKLYSFGVGSSGQLGYKTENTVSPIHIKALHNIHSVYAGGDQSFIIEGEHISDSEKVISVRPDYRIQSPDSKIWTISEEFINEICRLTITNSAASYLDELSVEMFFEPALQLKVEKGIFNFVEGLLFFITPTFLNASFLMSELDGPTWKLAVDLIKAEAVLSKLNRIKVKEFKEGLESVLINDLLPKLKTLWISPHKDFLPAFVLFTLLPVFYSGEYPSIPIEYFGGFVSAPKSVSTIVSDWLFNSPNEQLLRLISVCKKTIVYILDSKTMTTFQKDTSCADCLKFLQIMYQLNKDKMCLSYHTFTIPQLPTKLDLQEDYFNWIEPEIERFSFCDYPFVFDGVAKTELLKLDQSFQMRVAMERAALNPTNILFSLLFRIDPREAQFLHIDVNRDNLVNDFVRQISSASTRELKKPLKVKFIGEEAVDVGGVRKEFFLSLTKEILNPKFGLFASYEESRLMWFNGSSYDDEDDLYYIIGLLCGLAIYNLTIINFPFPLALYKKLLNEKVDLNDLKELNPSVGHSLQQILEYKDPDLESVFSLFFEINEDSVGKVKTVELKPGGSNVPVTQENKFEFVELYVNYVFNVSVEDHFDSFREAFEEVCGSKILRLFHPQELQDMVIGNEDYDWGELEEYCVYKEGYEASDPVIKRFWEVFYSLEVEQKKKFLLFLTGNDKIPILGMKSIQLCIQRMNDERYLPVAHTCFNLLDLPPYQTTEKMKYKLLQAIQQTEGFALV